MMLVIGNGKLFTRNDEMPFVENGAVAIEGTKIAAVGETEAIKKQYGDAEFIDAKGGVIMPAFINTHEHIYSAMARGLSIKGYNPKGFLDILDGQWWTIDRHLTLEQTKYSAVETLISCIRNGVTTVFDHHASYGEVPNSLSIIADVAKQFGVRSCLCYEVSDRNGVDQMKAAVAENVRFGKEAKQDPSRLAAMMGLHASFTLSTETLDYVKAHNEDQLGYHVHVAEGPEDVADSKEKYGMTPVRRLVEAGILCPKSIAGHCVHVTDEDVALLKKSQAKVVHNPESNMGNAVGTTDILKLLDAGITVGLGTDGYTNDMLESYKVANCLVKHEQHKPYVGWGEVPHMLFENNRKMANEFFDTTVGILKKGAAADVIVLDYAASTPLDENNINGHLLFGANGMYVVTTISDGVPRMIDRKLQGIDKAEVMDEVLATSKGLWKRLNP